MILSNLRLVVLRDSMIMIAKKTADAFEKKAWDDTAQAIDELLQRREASKKINFELDGVDADCVRDRTGRNNDYCDGFVDGMLDAEKQFRKNNSSAPADSPSELSLAAPQPDHIPNATKLREVCIPWLNKCPECGNKRHVVTTINGGVDRLFDDDGVECGKCGHKGVIQCLEGCAFVLWATKEEMRESTAPAIGHIRDATKMVSAAVHDVIAERDRQITAEGWTPEHDDKYEDSQLSRAAAGYTVHAAGNGYRTARAYQTAPAPVLWPWSPHWWKPTTPRRDLVKAAALILAEIERIDRCAPQSEGGAL